MQNAVFVISECVVDDNMDDNKIGYTLLLEIKFSTYEINVSYRGLLFKCINLLNLDIGIQLIRHKLHNLLICILVICNFLSTTAPTLKKRVYMLQWVTERSFSNVLRPKIIFCLLHV